MMKETNIARTSGQRAAATSQINAAREKTGQTTQAAKAAAPDHGHIAERAYELYMQRGQHEGQALENWLDAERQLSAVAGTK
jgi:hypothetical protein